jgi:hypothetical protein
MKKKYLIANRILFIISILLFCLFIKWQVFNEFMFFNETIAMLLFCASIPLKLYKMRTGQYLVFTALLILLFSPLSYSYTITDVNGFITHHEAKFNSLISPITFVILILFTMANFSAIFDLYQVLTKGSDKEQKDALSKETEYYYNKFSGYSSAGLADIFEMYNDYPVEAQLALKRIKEEKGIN